jgi:hypothetical protein
MISKEETHLVRRILEGIRDLASGRSRFEELTQSTSEKIAVVLACDLPMPSFLINEKDGWEKLNELQRRTVATINPKFQARKWTDIPVYFG